MNKWFEIALDKWLRMYGSIVRGEMKKGSSVEWCGQRRGNELLINWREFIIGLSRIVFVIWSMAIKILLRKPTLAALGLQKQILNHFTL